MTHLFIIMRFSVIKQELANFGNFIKSPGSSLNDMFEMLGSRMCPIVDAGSDDARFETNLLAQQLQLLLEALSQGNVEWKNEIDSYLQGLLNETITTFDLMFSPGAQVDTPFGPLEKGKINRCSQIKHLFKFKIMTHNLYFLFKADIS